MARYCALAQGALSIGGFGGGGGGNSVQVNHLTVGRVPPAALVQIGPARRRSRRPTPSRSRSSDPDFSDRAAARRRGQPWSSAPTRRSALDSGTVEVHVPRQYRAPLPDLIARLESLPVDVDSRGSRRHQRTHRHGRGGGRVRLGPAAVAHGNLSVRISTRFDVSQPAPFSQGQTAVVPREKVDVTEGEAQLVALEEGATLEDVVRALNALGVTPRDIIAIMQALKAAGALRAELVIL